MSTIVQASWQCNGRRAAAPFSRGEMINRAAVRRFALDAARQAGRGETINRVANSVYIDCERVVREHIRGLVAHHPSAFRTLEAD